MSTYARIPHPVLQDRDLRPSSKLVFAAIFDRIGANDTAWPGYRTLAADTGLHTDAIGRAVEQLVAAGFIIRSRRGRNGFEYAIGARAPAKCERPQNTDTSARKLQVTAPAKHGFKRPQNADRTRLKNQTHEPDSRIRQRTRSRARVAAGDWSQVETMLTGDALRTDAFRAAWAEWSQHRKEIKKPLTPSTVGRQIKQLEACGHAQAIETIERSIQNGWQGLFPAGDDQRGRPAASNGKIVDSPERRARRAAVVQKFSNTAGGADLGEGEAQDTPGGEGHL